MEKLGLIITLIAFVIQSNAQYISGNCHDSFGKKKLSDGIYEGYWKNSQMNGIGVFEFSNGNKVMGEFVKGKVNGYATFYYKNKEGEDAGYFNGYCLNNKLEGTGVYFEQNGNVTPGVYIEDALITPTSMELNENNPINCEGNCINGYGRITEANNTVMQGFFVEGIFRNGEPVN